MTRFACNGIPARCAGLVLAGSILLVGSSARSGGPAIAKKSSTATRKIVGRALDADGRPVGGATVCLSHEDDSDNVLAEPIVLAQTQTRADGRFELLPLESDLKKVVAEPPTVFEVWIQKTGLAPSHRVLLGEQADEVLLITLKNETRLTVRLRDASEAPCGDVTVAPSYLLLADHRWVTVPKPIKDRLKAHSAADGRVAVSGFDGLGQTLTVETPEFGGQSLVINGNQSCPLTATLRKTRLLKGRYILPNGESADLRRVGNYLAAYYQEHNRSHCSKGRAEAHWWVAQKPSVSQDGEFTAPNLPSHGTGYLKLDLPPDLPLVPDVRPNWSLVLRCEKSQWGTGLVLRCCRPQRAFSPLLKEMTFRLETVLPMQLAFLKAACDACTQGDLQVDIPLRMGVQITRVFRDSRTKRPVSGLSVRIRPAVTRPPIEEALNIAPWVAQLIRLPLQDAYLVGVGDVAVNTLLAMLWQRSDVRGEIETDADGRVRICVFPGRTYEISYERPQFDQPDRHRPVQVIHVPNGVDKLDLGPIEVVQPRTINGGIENAAGQPIPGIRIRKICGGEGGQQNHGDGVSRWTTSDPAGQFRFDDVAAGTTVTLVPVRDGLPLADPVVLSLNGDQVVHLHEKKCEYAALAGRILGVDQKPIAGAQVIVEIENSPDRTRCFRTPTDENGSFRTPARFPKHLKYRMTVRRVLKDVASSEWMCPAASGTRFRDLVVDRAKLGLGCRIERDEVVARVNGQPIRASEIFERACAEELQPGGMSLLAAGALVKSGEMTQGQYRELQETAIRKYARDYVRTRLLTRALESTLEPDRQQQLEQAVNKMFDEYVEKIKRDLKVKSHSEVDQKLQSQGTSLASLKVEFRYSLLADEFVRQAGRQDGEVDWDQALAFYNAHRDLYAESEKVAWQLLEVQFDPPPTQQAQTQENESVEDPFLRASRSQQARNERGVDERLQIDLGSFDPKPDKDAASGSKTSSAPLSADSDKSVEAGQKKPDEIDFVAYADRAPSRPGRQKAHNQIQKALSQIQQDKSFDAVVKKYSNGPHADRGGWQSRLNPGSIADQATGDALRKLAEGQTSGIIEAGHSFRIVRLVTRTPAGLKPFEEVEDSIKPAIQRQKQLKALADVLSQATIECPYIDDVSSILPPPPCPIPKPREDDAFAQ